MKKYTLSKENKAAATAIGRYLKEHKAMSLVEFKRQWCKARGWKGWYAFGRYKVEAHEWYFHENNYYNTIQFLRNHNIMTRKTVNGFVLYVATQKCVRAKEENWFK
jgi:hypothetical protein